MKGFNVQINDEKVISAACDGSVSVFIRGENCSGKGNISIRAMDSKSYHIEWIERGLKIGDKVKVRVTEINNISPFKCRTPSDRRELKETYLMLKKELAEKELL